MSRGAIVVGVALSLLGGGCSQLPWLEAEGPKVASVAVRESTLLVSVRAEGELEADKASPVAVPRVPTGALKIKDLVPEGSLVESGEVVVVFDASQLQIELSNHQATLRSAELRMERGDVVAAMENGAIRVMRDVAALERDHSTSFELDETVYSRLDILDNELQGSEAEATIGYAEAALRLRGESQLIDRNIIGVERDTTESKIGDVETSLGQLVLESPLPGMVVYKKNWRGSTASVGDSLWPGNVVMSIVDPSSVSLRAFVLERDGTGVVEGAEAIIRVDARPELELTGKVKSVQNVSRPIRRGLPTKYFETVISIDDAEAGLLKPGMKASAEIIVDRLEEAVVVPRTAVRGGEGEEVAPHVFVEGLGAPQRRDVELGRGDHVLVQVVSGVSAGERVLLGDASGSGQS